MKKKQKSFVNAQKCGFRGEERGVPGFKVKKSRT